MTQDRFDMIYVHVWDINICFEIAMTIVKTYTPKKSNSWLRPCQLPQTDRTSAFVSQKNWSEPGAWLNL